MATVSEAAADNRTPPDARRDPEPDSTHDTTGLEPEEDSAPRNAEQRPREPAPKVIKFGNVSKRFTLHREKPHSFQEVVVSLFGLRSPSRRGVALPEPAREEFWALRDVSFGVRAGEVLGIIGENGSGKSTTLKLITRILEPTSGRISVRGKVSALLELGAGFHPDLTGRENIYLNGSLLGLSRKELDERLYDIVSFAELEEFIDTPVKHYSSGMTMRLGFAVAVNVNPDILLTDEVLAVGDEAFQRKCLDHISALRRRGVTIVYVSHALESVRSLASRVIWLDHGRLIADGPPGDVIDRYLTYENEKHAERLRAEREGTAPLQLARPEALERPAADVQADQDDDITEEEPRGAEARAAIATPDEIALTGRVRISGIEFLDENRVPAEAFQTGKPLRIRVRYMAGEPLRDPTVGLAIFTEAGVQLNGPNTRFAGVRLPPMLGEGWVDYVVDELPLLAGRYYVTAAITGAELTEIHDHRHRAASFVVQPTPALPERWGLLLIEARWEHGGVRADQGASE